MTVLHLQLDMFFAIIGLWYSCLLLHNYIIFGSIWNLIKKRSPLL